MKWSVLVSACLLLQCFVACSIAQAASETPAQLLVTKPRSEFDINHQYYTSLLKKALTKAAAGRAIPELKPTFAMEQGRALRELAKANRWMSSGYVQTWTKSRNSVLFVFR